MNQWITVDGCASVVITANIRMEFCTVTGPNALAPLQGVPDGVFIILVINGYTFMPVGSNPPFSLNGSQITWNTGNTLFGFNTSDRVICAYTFGST